MDLQRFYVFAMRGHFLIGYFQSFGEADDAVHVFGPSPHISFLRTAQNIRVDLSVFFQIKKSSTLGTMEFMPCSRSGVYKSFGKDMGIVSYCLYRVRVKEGFMFLAKLANRVNIIDVSDLVVGVHDADEGVRVVFQERL